MTFRPSRFVHEIELSKGILALYGAESLQVAFLNAAGASVWHRICDTGCYNPQEFESECEEQVPQELIQLGFLVPANSDEHQRILEHYARLVPEEPEITVLKLFLTTYCNLACTYCLINENLKAFARAPQHTSLDTAVQAVNVFAQHARRSSKPEKNIFLYGGEPLTNYSVMKELVVIIRQWESRGTFNGGVELVLETNGLLLTKEVCDFLAHYNVYIIVSLDGLPAVHDKLRLRPGGQGSFKDALNGYRRAVESGCTAVVSTVASPLMLQNIEAAIDFLVHDVGTPSIGLDLLHVRQGCLEEKYNMEPEELAFAYIKAFEVARNYGLYIEHVQRRIRPFVEGSVRIKDCPACGSRMVVAPDGAIGLCEGFIGSREFFGLGVFDTPDLRDDPSFKAWNRCSPLLSHACFSCSALAICGGGCPYNSYVTGGQLIGYDTKTCVTSQAFVKWLISDLADRIGREFLSSQKFYVPKKEERLRVLGNIPSRLTLPLIKNISRFAEVTQ